MSTLIQRLYFPSVSSSSKGLSLGTPRRPFNHSGLAAQYLLFWLISVSLTQTGSMGYWLLWASSKGLLVACWMQEKPVRHKKTLISRPRRPKTLKFGSLVRNHLRTLQMGAASGFWWYFGLALSSHLRPAWRARVVSLQPPRREIALCSMT